MIITVNDLVTALGALAAGVALGSIFFGGLWFTLRKKARSPHLAGWLFLSFLIRTAIVLSGFYWVGAGSMQRMVGCLAGFIAARFIVMQLTKSRLNKHFSLAKKMPYET